MENVNVYKTKDFYLSACLLAYGISIQKLEPTVNSAYLFVFETSIENAEKIIKLYWDRSLKLPIRDFVDAINELKTRIHTGN